ncbi:hypothetical protein AQ477_20095 [Burkholderia thailandensis]|nr:hypothetical protein AQ477_20095 [Burkholderia thailandensis]KVG13771.1 hypothetical protein WJ25_03485 [Burkholderia thailandensis]KXF58035.1 hypothetical protein AQ476_25195 [Burkholderia thailandensis]
MHGIDDAGDTHRRSRKNISDDYPIDVHRYCFFSIRNRWIEECAASLRERSIVLVGFDTMRQRPP